IFTSFESYHTCYLYNIWRTLCATTFALLLLALSSDLLLLLPQAIDDEEAKFHGVRLQTSPPVDPLNFGSRYIVSSNAHLEIIPEELKLSYRSPGEIQIFSKVYAGKMKEPIIVEIAEKRHKTLVWRTLVKPVDLQFHSAAAPPPLSGECTSDQKSEGCV
uniref:FIIND domain-containing protein n=1 Tax=Canis lupus dingo TaxID=286419 RepID=A0A8C0LPC3_CANLU